MLSYHQKRFLIVDDFSDFRSSVRSMLRELGVKEVAVSYTHLTLPTNREV